SRLACMRPSSGNAVEAAILPVSGDAGGQRQLTAPRFTRIDLDKRLNGYWDPALPQGLRPDAETAMVDWQDGEAALFVRFQLRSAQSDDPPASNPKGPIIWRSKADYLPTEKQAMAARYSTIAFYVKIGEHPIALGDPAKLS